jgi:hypothetical protein
MPRLTLARGAAIIANVLAAPVIVLLLVNPARDMTPDLPDAGGCGGAVARAGVVAEAEARAVREVSMTEDALLRAVLADPLDDAPRLIMADWLDEHG